MAIGRSQVSGTYEREARAFATSANGRYVFGADDEAGLTCMDRSGALVWRLATGCGPVCSLRVLGDELYLVTTDGLFARVDISERAMRAGRRGTVPVATTLLEAKSRRQA